MAAFTITARTAKIRRLTVDDVFAMVDAGILGDGERIELEDGVLVELSPQDPKHEVAKERLTWYFGQAGLRLRVEAMFLTDGGYLLPDLQVAEEFPVAEHPRTVPLAIEVANTSQRRDRAKAATYARAGVAEYWIVDVAAGLVVIHREPSGAAYALVSEHRDGEIRPLLDAPPLSLDALFDRL